jgi:6-pyruvoyltetrahydropterin/6-carboxytetrahydropterin synthase
MFTISKRFSFAASHVIEGLPSDHPCSRLHGHNYSVEVVLASETVDETGFVVDYNALSAFRDILDAELDHRHLNDVLPCPTTAECLAQWLFGRARDLWPQVVAIRVSETPRTWAEYRP